MTSIEITGAPSDARPCPGEAPTPPRARRDRRADR
jgi:hypothetical protein